MGFAKLGKARRTKKGLCCQSKHDGSQPSAHAGVLLPYFRQHQDSFGAESIAVKVQGLQEGVSIIIENQCASGRVMDLLNFKQLPNQPDNWDDL